MRLPRVLTVLFVLTLSTAVHASQDQQAPPLELTIDASASPSELATDATTPLPELAIDANVSPAPPAVEERLPALANQTATQPQLPAHTGWRALAGDVLGDFKDFPRRRSTWVILGVGGVAALSVHPLDETVTENLADSEAAGNFFAAGKWIGNAYVQIGTSVGLYLVGRYLLPHAEGKPKTNKVTHLGFDLIRGQILSQVLVQGIKVVAQRDRPTGECCSFPSGHAATAFATASILERHFGYRGAWPIMVAAGYVAASRLADNRHFLSDVVFGSAVGMASGWTVVGRHGRDNFAVMPQMVPGGVEIVFTKLQ
jgi:hypothetical protein